MTEVSVTTPAPRVSIVIPAYNMAPYIGETLDSVLAQRFSDYEVIVVDDGSTDDTAQVLAPFMTRIIYIKQENRGLSAARNVGMQRARGEYISLLDADDLLLPEYLAKMVALLEADERTDVVYPNAVLFGLPRWEGRLFQDVYPSTMPVTLEKLLARECTVFVSALFRRALLDQVGMFDEQIRWGGEDFDLWLRMAQQGCQFAFTTEPLVRYRKRDDSLSSSEERTAHSAIYIARKFLADRSHTPNEIRLAGIILREAQARLAKVRAKQLILARDFAGARQSLAQARQHYRSYKLTLAQMALRFMPGLTARFVAHRAGPTEGQATIAFFENGIAFGGAITCLAALIQTLDRKRFRAVVLSSHNDEDSRRVIEETKGKFVFFRQYRRSKRISDIAWWMGQRNPLLRYFLLTPLLLGETALRVWYGLKAWRLLAGQRVRIVHLNNSMAANQEGIVAAKLLGAKCILHLRAFEYPSLEARLFARWIDYFVPVSQAVADSLRQLGIPSHRIQVIYDGIDRQACLTRAAEPLNNGKHKFAELNIGVVGTLLPWKGQRIFIEAVAILVNEMNVRDCRFFIVGGEVPGAEEYNRELEELVAESGLSDRVEFAGHQENVFHFLERLDVMVHTSILPEPFGMVIIEAMALGRPVIATRLGGPMEIIDDGLDGLLIRANDPRALAEAIYALISDPERRRQMAEAARRKVETRFTLDRFARDVEQVYASLN